MVAFVVGSNGIGYDTPLKSRFLLSHWGLSELVDVMPPTYFLERVRMSAWTSTTSDVFIAQRSIHNVLQLFAYYDNKWHTRYETW